MNIEYCEAKSNDAKEIINYLNIVAGQTDNLNYGNICFLDLFNWDSR